MTHLATSPTEDPDLVRFPIADLAALRRRIQGKVVVTEAGCWEYQGSRSRHGYCDMEIRGRSYRVHRVSYAVFVAPFLSELSMCHRCDNPPCCNPDHLFPGTVADNLRDAAAKGRLSAPGARGETHPFVTVRDERAAEAVRRYAVGESQRSIAADLGVSQGSISHWVNGRTRSYLAGVS